jgi:mono/diheme cytochrome c family protein
MRTLLRWTARLLVVLIAALAGFVAYLYVVTSRQMSREYDVKVPVVPVPTDAASIDRGKYIATRVSTCTECHGDDLGGKIVEDSFVMGRLAATNLTRGRGGVGARYSNDDFVRAIVHGVRSDRRSVIFMPSSEFQYTEADLGALIAYIRSVPPVDRELPASRIGPMVRALTVLAGFPLMPASVIDHERVALVAEKDLADPVAAGDKLVSMGGCRGCHGPTFIGGGGPPPGASNITPVGIGEWTREQFVTAVREHRRPNGSTILETMPRGYGQMSDVDLHNIYAYLKTVPPAGTKLPQQQQ